MKIINIIILLIAFTSTSTRAGGAFDVATEHTQILNNIELIAQVIEQIQTVATLKEQLEDMLENSEKLDILAFGNGKQLLSELAQAVKKNRVIAYSAASIEAEFERIFPGFDDYIQLTAKDWTPEYIQARYEEWNESNRNSLKSALEVIHLQDKDFSTEEGLFQTLQGQTATAVGRQQSLQVGNEIAIEQLRQSQKLRQLIMTQIQMQANFRAYETERTGAEQAIKQQHQKTITDSKSRIILGNGKSY